MSSHNQAIEVLRAVYSNAKRLAEDVKLLLGEGRYATAYSLSVAAIEELGKFTLLADKHFAEESVHDRSTRSHVQKQKAAASALLSYRHIKYLNRGMKDAGNENKVVKGKYLTKSHNKISGELRKKNRLNRKRENIDESEFNSIIKIISDETLRMAASDLERLQSFRDLKTGDAEVKRRRGIYVDVLDNYRIVSQPAEISADACQEMANLLKEIFEAVNYDFGTIMSSTAIEQYFLQYNREPM